MQSCRFLRQVLSSECDIKLTQQVYYDFQTRYMDQFFADILRSQQACFGGRLELAVRSRKLSARERRERRRTYRQGNYIVTVESHTHEYTWAALMGNKLRLPVCRTFRRVVVPVLLFMGPFRAPPKAPLHEKGGMRTYVRVPVREQTALRTEWEAGQGVDADEWQAHYTVLLIDNDAKTIEYFESNGADAPWVLPVETLVQSFWARNARFRHYEFIDTTAFCPGISWQAVSKTALCAYWASFFAVLRVSCPTVPRKVLIENLLARGRKFLVDLMQHWHCFMWVYSDRRHILGAWNLLQEARSLLDQNDFWVRFTVPVGNAFVRAYNRAFRLYYDSMQARRAFFVLRTALRALPLQNR